MNIMTPTAPEKLKKTKEYLEANPKSELYKYILLLNMAAGLPYKLEPKEKEEVVFVPIIKNDSIQPLDISKRHWAFVPIMKAIKAGYTSTNHDNKFEPNKATTRAEFISMLVRATNLRPAGEHLDFIDLVDTKEINDDIKTGVSEGFISGFANNKFAPMAAISRQDAAVVLATAINRYYGGYIPRKEKYFIDQNKIAAYASESVRIVSTLGLINSNANGQFEPLENISKAETTAIMVAYHEMITGKVLALPPVEDFSDLDYKPDKILTPVAKEDKTIEEYQIPVLNYNINKHNN